MALVTCPDCRGTLSDAAHACIHCGRPMVAPAAGANAQPSGGLFIACVVVGSAIAVGYLVWRNSDADGEDGERQATRSPPPSAFRLPSAAPADTASVTQAGLFNSNLEMASAWNQAQMREGAGPIVPLDLVDSSTMSYPGSGRRDHSGLMVIGTASPGAVSYLVVSCKPTDRSGALPCLNSIFILMAVMEPDLGIGERTTIAAQMGLPSAPGEAEVVRGHVRYHSTFRTNAVAGTEFDFEATASGPTSGSARKSHPPPVPVVPLTSVSPPPTAPVRAVNSSPAVPPTLPPSPPAPLTMKAALAALQPVTLVHGADWTFEAKKLARKKISKWRDNLRLSFALSSESTAAATLPRLSLYMVKPPDGVASFVRLRLHRSFVPSADSAETDAYRGNLRDDTFVVLLHHIRCGVLRGENYDISGCPSAPEILQVADVPNEGTVVGLLRGKSGR